MFVIIDKLKKYKGISVFIVFKFIEGLILGKKEDKLGIRVFFICFFIFENCCILKENFLGELGFGFKIVMVSKCYIFYL